MFYVLALSLLNWACSWAKTELTQLDHFLSTVLGVCLWSLSSLTHDSLSCSEIGLKFDINEDMVKEKLLKLKVHKSKGPDGIHPRVLKELASVICVPLAIIFKTSIRSGTLPDEWKLANVTAIHKNGHRQMAGNYRPVSLTSVVCKVLESIVREQVINHLKSNKLFSNKQFGFIGGRSTTLQLLRVIDEWTKILDNGDLSTWYTLTLRKPSIKYHTAGWFWS